MAKGLLKSLEEFEGLL